MAVTSELCVTAGLRRLEARTHGRLYRVPCGCCIVRARTGDNVMRAACTEYCRIPPSIRCCCLSFDTGQPDILVARDTQSRHYYITDEARTSRRSLTAERWSTIHFNYSSNSTEFPGSGCGVTGLNTSGPSIWVLLRPLAARCGARFTTCIPPPQVVTLAQVVQADGRYSHSSSTTAATRHTRAPTCLVTRWHKGNIKLTFQVAAGIGLAPRGLAEAPIASSGW